MKRVSTLLIAFCLILSVFTLPAHAASETYFLDELGMSIDIPKEFDVFTRDIKSNDPLLNEYGITKQDLQYMYDGNFYIDAWDIENFYELIVTMSPASLEDYNDFSESKMNTMISELPAEYERNGVTCIEMDIYDHSQTKFVRAHISQLDGSDLVYSLQYNTVINGNGINITLHSYDGQIGSSEKALMKEIIDSVKFDSLPLASSQGSDGFVYTDEKSGMRFTVPANWIEDEASEDAEYVDATFISADSIIVFTSEDIYKSNFEFGDGFITRDMLADDIFTIEDVADICSCDVSEVSIITLGGKEYYFAELNADNSHLDAELVADLCFLLRWENGILYMFQFHGDSNSASFDDFSSLVSSCEYPEFELDEAETEDKYLLIGFIAIAALLLTPFIYLAPIIIYRFAVRKRPVSKKKARNIALIYGLCFSAVIAIISLILSIFWILTAVLLVLIIANYKILKCGKDKSQVESIDEISLAAKGAGIENVYDAASQPDSSDSSFRLQYCHICGNKLIEGSAFCNKCGTRIK